MGTGSVSSPIWEQDERQTGLTLSGTVTAGAFKVAAGGTLTTDSGTATGAAGAVTLSKQAGTVTTESLTTAAGAAQTYTVTNALVTATSKVFVTLGGGTNTTQPVYATNVKPGAGSFTVDLRNGHGATALNGTLVFSFLVVA